MVICAEAVFSSHVFLHMSSVLFTICNVNILLMFCMVTDCNIKILQLYMDNDIRFCVVCGRGVYVTFVGCGDAGLVRSREHFPQAVVQQCAYLCFANVRR